MMYNCQADVLCLVTCLITDTRENDTYDISVLLLSIKRYLKIRTNGNYDGCVIM